MIEIRFWRDAMGWVVIDAEKGSKGTLNPSRPGLYEKIYCLNRNIIKAPGPPESPFGFQ